MLVFLLKNTQTVAFHPVGPIDEIADALLAPFLTYEVGNQICFISLSKIVQAGYKVFSFW